LPPLRERKEDIPILVNYFVNRYAQRAGRKIDTIQKKSLEALQNIPGREMSANCKT